MAGKAYQVSLHLGMTSVKFDAAITDWPTTQVADNTDLPINAPSASATASSDPADANANKSVTIPATLTKGVFAVSGLAEGASTTEIDPTSADWLSYTPATGAVIGADGLLNVEFTAAANNTVNERSVALKVTENGGTNKATLTITQQARALGLSITTTPKAGDNVIILDAAAEMSATDWTGANITVQRQRGASTTTLAPNASPGANQYKIEAEGTGDDKTGKITLGESAVAGDIYTITIQSGQATAESKSFTVEKTSGSIAAFVPTSTVYVIGESFTSLTTTATGGGTVTYEIAKTGGAGATTPSINENSGEVSFTSPTAGDVFTVTATVADNTTYTYSPKTTSYKIYIKNAGTLTVNSSVSYSAAAFSTSNKVESQVTNNTGNGTVTYEVVTNQEGGNANLDPNTGAITFTVAPTVGNVITVKAKVADSETYYYATKEIVYTITITA